MAIPKVPSQASLSETTQATEALSSEISLADGKSTELTASSSSSTSSLSSSSSSTRVSFGDVQIREYERIVGDHPDTKIGVPLALGWHYSEQELQTVDYYEEHKTSKGILRMSSITRKNILREVFGIPDDELRNAEKEVQRIRKRREFSNKQSPVIAKTESAMRGFARRIRRAMTAENFLRGMSVASSGMVAPMGVSAGSS
mmetsp:Transcript_5434/g.15994  ORF Transcript_5434/g.15994 Transcript_5434/m.15994 type:complete len:201 (+) Transcript_5434:178-780(+)